MSSAIAGSVAEKGQNHCGHTKAEHQGAGPREYSHKCPTLISHTDEGSVGCDGGCLVALLNQQASHAHSPNLSSGDVQGAQFKDFDSHVRADEQLDLRELVRAIRRRKKLVGVVAGSVIAVASVITAYQRIFRPVYQGSFSLLITDPLNSEGQGRSSMGQLNVSTFEQLARNTTSNDIPTLIEVLQSPVLLKPVANAFNLTTDSLISRIDISTGGSKRNVAEGVLNVRLKGRKPKSDEKLLKALSDAYLRVALQQRQQRLADGLDFLNKQAPQLEAKLDQIQGELARFRVRHSLLEPTLEGGTLKEREASVEGQVLALEAERNRLFRVRSEIDNGTLTARGFQEAIGTNSGSRNAGLTVSDVDQSLLQQLFNVETELATARSRFTPNSSMVQGLEERLRQLKPLLKQNQLEAVDAALSLNYGRLSTVRGQQTTLNNQFLKQPALIKEYDTLQQRLELARQNLSGLVSAREKFQLEIAQRSVPWRVIAPAKMNMNPIKPSVPRNLAIGTIFGLMAGVLAGFFATEVITYSTWLPKSKRS